MKIILDDLLQATHILLKGTNFFTYSDLLHSVIHVSDGKISFTMKLDDFNGTAPEVVRQIRKILEDYDCFGNKPKRFRTYPPKTTTATRR